MDSVADKLREEGGGPVSVVARVFQPLLKEARFKAAHGGRGSGKSHFFAEMLVRECVRKPGTFAVCIREVQKTLAESSKRLIEDKIYEMGVGDQFDIQGDGSSRLGVD
jgi:phage terminase large subunit